MESATTVESATTAESATAAVESAAGRSAHDTVSRSAIGDACRTIHGARVEAWANPSCAALSGCEGSSATLSEISWPSSGTSTALPNIALPRSAASARSNSWASAALA